jgi:phosphoserine phosphatase
MDHTGHAHPLSTADMQTILAVTRALAAPFDLRGMLAEVAAAARQVLHAERASVWLLDAAAQELFLEVSSDLRQLRVPLGAGLVGACAAARVPVNVPDCYADARFNTAVDRASGFHTRCSLSLPLIDHRNELVGVMQVLNRADGVFDDADVALGQALAAQCALALSRVRMSEAVLAGELMRQELELASQVQRSTLPKRLPDLPGYDMHGHFQPAEQTGGDTYDLALLQQGLLVVLADASGHGIAPALSVTQMHAMLRMGFRLGGSLETVFTAVNDELARTLPDGRFVTAFVGLLDPASHGLRFISGGQGPILHWRAASADFAVHRATSFPMGAGVLDSPARLRPAVTLPMAPGDMLVLLSDGIYECASPEGELFGRQRVCDLVRAHAAGPAAALSAALLQAVHAHARGAAQDDDITIALLRRQTGTEAAV